MKLGKYSMGIGDRFNHQGKAQLSAIIKAKNNGVDLHVGVDKTADNFMRLIIRQRAKARFEPCATMDTGVI